jgi:xylulokinase
VTLVCGIDSSTQSCKVVIRDADSGRLLRSGRAPHPDGTEVGPEAWWQALQQAIADAGGIDDVAAIAVGAQQHGLVALDENGGVIRPSLLWNDTRSAGAAATLVDELGAEAWAEAVGLVPVASFTVTKLRWLAEHELDNAARTAAVCLPHDWLTWKLRGSTSIRDLTTDRSDASGTGYWSPQTESYRLDLLRHAFGREPLVPRVLHPSAVAGETASGVRLGPGAGDNAGSALGIAARPGDVIVSIGTSGVVTAVAHAPVSDSTGTVAGFADATGRFLPLIATLNAARVLDAACSMLAVDHAELSRLALTAPGGADGLVVVPYLEGERTPNRPDTTGAIHGLRLGTATPAHVARAAVEGMLCGLADGLDALLRTGPTLERVLLIGGGSASEAVRRIAPSVFGVPVEVPEPSEHVADGAARQAAWVLTGGDEPPEWPDAMTQVFNDDPAPWIRERYAEVRDLVASRRS